MYISGAMCTSVYKCVQIWICIQYVGSGQRIRMLRDPDLQHSTAAFIKKNKFDISLSRTAIRLSTARTAISLSQRCPRKSLISASIFANFQTLVTFVCSYAVFACRTFRLSSRQVQGIILTKMSGFLKRNCNNFSEVRNDDQCLDRSAYSTHRRSAATNELQNQCDHLHREKFSSL